MSNLPGIDQAGAWVDQVAPEECTYRELTKRSAIPLSLLWHRRNGRRSIHEKARDQQYLTQQEEEVLVKYFLFMAESGYHLPIGFLPKIARHIKRQRNSTFCTLQQSLECCDVKLPGHNWGTGFRKRHPDLNSLWKRPNRKKRCDQHIYDSIDTWLELIGQELGGTKVLFENTYHAIATGFIREFPRTMVSIVNNDEMRAQLETDNKTKFITAVECTSAAGQFLNPLIVWPTQFQKTRAASSISSWHHQQSQNGYLDKNIIFNWITETFAPQTQTRANGRPRLLISDTVSEYSTRPLVVFCNQENIRLCRLHSLTAQKLQPRHCDPFEGIQTTLQKEFERAYSQCEDGEKILFTPSYNRARHEAFEVHLALARFESQNTASMPTESSTMVKHIQTQVFDDSPKSAEEFISLRRDIEHALTSEVLDDATRGRIFKLLGAAEAGFAKRDSSVGHTGSG